MINKILLIENNTFQILESAQQAHLEIMLKRVCGAKVYSAESLNKAINSNDFSECVLVIPAEITANNNNEVLKTLQYIEKHKPFSKIFAILFVLYPVNANLSPADLSSVFWIDLLDKFYDEAIPTSFLVMYRENAEVQSFHTSATVSGLFRDLDNLAELSRIQLVVSDLERRIRHIEADI